MKEKYLRPAIINSGTLEGNGIVPFALAAKGVAALLGGFVLGKAAAKAMARPTFKLPSLTKGRNSEDDFCLA
ncbi:MAG: hypothetical protein IJQ85_08085 [Selenomonadaceae bacterium]|nr:hypothetical protein [Selenomonadaceae bacterium]